MPALDSIPPAELAQLKMVWPPALLSIPPVVNPPAGYRLRPYQPGDEPRFYEVMALAGWPGWDDARLDKWIGRILPDGWFMAIHDASGVIVASAMCLHGHETAHPFGGEVGWVASDLAHKGRGLGRLVTAAVTARFINAGYRNLYLYTEDYRLAALKIYLSLGYQPFLYQPDMAARWQPICAQLNWPYLPDAWRTE